MNTGQLILALFFFLVGGWLIPTSLKEANSPLAPYRAIRGVLYVLIGIGWWLSAIGFKAAVVLGP